MKKLLVIAVLALAPLFAGAQEQKEVVKFLGIPVDGDKTEMISKLKEKGFRTDPDVNDALLGEFNGSQVQVLIQTNKNKVSRIIVTDIYSLNARTAKNTYNNLYSQFENNSKYLSAWETAKTIPDDEDISYEISVHNKQYQAFFCQIPDSADFRLPDSIKSGEHINNYMSMLQEQEEKGNTNVAALLANFILDTIENRVWFTILEFDGEYRIAIYYENRYNMPNGEDL